MSGRDHLHRIELVFEIPGAPDDVWAAIATGPGISSWFLPTDVEPRVGGAIVTHMGEVDSPGTVTGYEAPRRFAYEEPEWAALAAHPDADVTPLATEFLVEAQSGGSCIVRVVSSAFGTGAEWEREFFEEMELGWRPWFDRLRLYVQHVPGQTATPLSTERVFDAASSAEVLAAMADDLAIGEVGTDVDARGWRGTVERIGEHEILLRIDEPAPAFLGLMGWQAPDGKVSASVHAHVFGDQAPAIVDRELPAWRTWLNSLDLKSASPTTKR